MKEALRIAQENRKQKKGKPKQKGSRKPKKLKLSRDNGKSRTADESENGGDGEWMASDHDDRTADERENGEDEEWMASDHDDRTADESENGEDEELMASDHDGTSDHEEHEEQQLEDLELPGVDDLNPDDFVLVRLNIKKTHVLYAGRIKQTYAAEDDDETSFGVQFLRRKTPKTFTFLFPAVNDMSEVLYEGIIGRLPKPLVHGGTARVARHLIFPVDFQCYADVLR